ncbi:hypothetical protein DE146DRAFT_240606 [Phaeosphaeria sp. MPI-PUGE-AT-0046c]|nr:hypothetical protein DE146DRAFT_240606 [Phaeosphaeria sp. MPI-PUGE-AT-0046c]
MDKPRTGRSARWGAACAPCAAAKTRCIRTQPSGQRQCDRCQSLEKDCVGQIPGPRKKRQVKPSRTALPEEDLNDVVFSSTTPIEEGSTVHGSSSNGSVDHAPDVHAVPLVSIEPQARVSISRAEIAINTPAYNLISSPPTALNCTCIATLTLEDRNPVDSDETLLSTYRNQLSNAFPFVIIPTGTTPRQLQTTRPFLMKVIRMVTSVRHLRSVRGQSRAVMEHISDAILMRSERSLDLLQGILVFLGFYHYHCMAHAQLNNLIRLAISLVEDLELSSCSKSQRRKGQLPLVRAEEPMFRTNEEKRALLGVWYISSNAGLVVEQLAFTKFTKYMDQCLTELGDASENKTDQLAIQLVRIQQHTEKIFHFHSSDSLAGETARFAQKPDNGAYGGIPVGARQSPEP